MKYILAIFMVLWSVSAFAAPFLTCDDYLGTDPTALPETFEIILDGAAAAIVSPAVQITGGMRMMWDLSTLTNGTHTITAKACNTWGCSASSDPYTFTKSVAGKPVNIKVRK